MPKNQILAPSASILKSKRIPNGNSMKSKRFTKAFRFAVLVGISSIMLGCAGLTLRSKEAKVEVAPPAEAPAIVLNSENARGVLPPNDYSELNKAELSQSGVIFSWAAQGDPQIVSESGCRLRLREDKSGETLFVTLKIGQPLIFQKLKPGHWEVKRLGCGLTKVYDLDGAFADGFTVKAGKVSALGWMVFGFDRRGLQIFREGGRDENTQWLQSLLGHWPKSSSKRESSFPISTNLISGFSGKEIPDGVVMRDEVVRLKAKGLRFDESVLQPLAKALQGCAATAMKTDPLRAGEFKMESQYLNGAYRSSKTLSAANALRDEFVVCLLRAHEAYSAPGSGEFFIETTY